MEKKRKKIRELKHLRALFAHADRDGGGTLSMDEFQDVLKQHRVRTMLSILEIDTSDAEGLFHLLDGGDGQIYMDEFVQGVMRVRGSAKAMDMVTLIFHSTTIQQMLRAMGQETQAQMKRLEALVIGGQQALADQTWGTISSRVCKSP